MIININRSTTQIIQMRVLYNAHVSSLAPAGMSHGLHSKLDMSEQMLICSDKWRKDLRAKLMIGNFA